MSPTPVIWQAFLYYRVVALRPWVLQSPCLGARRQVSRPLQAPVPERSSKYEGTWWCCVSWIFVWRYASICLVEGEMSRRSFLAAAERGAHAPREEWPTRIARNGAQPGQLELQPHRYLRQSNGDLVTTKLCA